MSPGMRTGLAYGSQELQSGTVDSPARPVVFGGNVAQRQPANAVWIGTYTYNSAAFSPLTGGPPGGVPANVRAAAMQLGPRGTGGVQVGEYLLQVSSYFYNQADYVTTINVYALPPGVQAPIVSAPAVQAPGRPISTMFHDPTFGAAKHPGGANRTVSRTLGAPMQPSWRPHTGTYPIGLGAQPVKHKGQWLKRTSDNRILMHPRAGFGAVAANDALATAIQSLLSAISTSAAANGGTAACSDVSAAATVFQQAYNTELGGTLSSNTYDSDTVNALNTALAAYNPSGSASIQSFSTGSAPAACSSSASTSNPASPTTTTTTTTTTPAAAAATSNTAVYAVAGIAVVGGLAYWAWKAKVL